MKLVIDISESDYQFLKEHEEMVMDNCNRYQIMILNGIPLSEILDDITTEK